MKPFLAVILTLVISTMLIFGQGSLTPPGAPTPTMKSLDQIEARKVISSAPFIINASGSYYLTNNLSVSSGDAITISVNNVSLNLNGFTISGTAASATGNAIKMSSGVRNITITNGIINSGVTVSGGTYSGPGFVSGIGFNGTAPANVRVSNITVSGVLANGIYLDINGTLVQNCLVDTAGANGIYAATVTDSFAGNCGSG